MLTDPTCWTLVQGAATGDVEAQERFATTYLPVIRAYLGARWTGGPLRQDIDDAVQETFVECLRPDGALDGVTKSGGGRFRTWLFAVVRNVARRFEERRRKGVERIAPQEPPSDMASDDERASKAFDRSWAQTLLQQAAARQAKDAESKGAAAKRRVELLRLRFAENLPIRDIAAKWNVDAAQLHHDYAKAREEFREALMAEVAFQCPGAERGDIERECQSLLEVIG